MYFGQLPKTSSVRITIAPERASTTRPLMRRRRRRSGSSTSTPSGWFCRITSRSTDRPRAARPPGRASGVRRRDEAGIAGDEGRPHVSRCVQPGQDCDALGLEEGLGALGDGARNSPSETPRLGLDARPRLHCPLALVKDAHADLDVDRFTRDSRSPTFRPAGCLEERPDSPIDLTGAFHVNEVARARDLQVVNVTPLASARPVASSMERPRTTAWPPPPYSPALSAFWRSRTRAVARPLSGWVLDDPVGGALRGPRASAR